MHPRVTEEWDNLVSLYRTARRHPQPERVEVDLRLDTTLYSREAVPVCVLIPPGYRATGPDGFLIPSDLHFADGTDLPTSDASAMGLPGWLLVSFHLLDEQGQSTWRPSADPARGDNLIGYFDSIEAFLAARCA